MCEEELEGQGDEEGGGKVLTLYIRIHCIAKPARYGNTHAIPYMACNVATARQPE